MRISFLVGGLVLAAAIIVGLMFWPEQQVDETVPTEVAETVAPEVSEAEVQPQDVQQPEDAPSVVLEETRPFAEPQEVPPPEPEVALPELADSDDFVRELTDGWGLPEVWTRRESLLPRLSVVLSNAADGRVPRGQLGFLSPTEPFKVRKVAGRAYIDAASYSRFDSMVALIERVPPAVLAEFVELTEPLIDEALGQLGRRESVATLLQRTLDRVDALPVTGDEVELVRESVTYEFADARLESLPEFEKQLLRMGPTNVRRLKRYAASFRASYVR